MNIGDKVRFLHGQEQGVITRIIDKDLIEVEIEDGFQIPVMKKELVVVAQEEGKYFRKQEVAVKERDEPFKPKSHVKRGPGRRAMPPKGIYLAFLPVNDRQLALYFINTLSFDLSYLVGEEQNDNFKGTAHGILAGQQSVKIREVLVSEFDQWPTWVMQLLFFHQGYYTLREPLVRKFRFKAATFFKNKRQAPLLDKPSFLFEIDAPGLSEGGKPVDLSQVKERMLTNTDEDKNRLLRLDRPPREVDLHIEKLTPKYDKMNNKEMLELQLKTFEEKLDSAIATGMDEIIFVHGVGGGVLRTAIQKKLSKLKNIQYYQDTQRDKFGYGATLVKIK